MLRLQLKKFVYTGKLFLLYVMHLWNVLWSTRSNIALLMHNVYTPGCTFPTFQSRYIQKDHIFNGLTAFCKINSYSNIYIYCGNGIVKVRKLSNLALGAWLTESFLYPSVWCLGIIWLLRLRLSHYLNLENAHILHRSFTHDSRMNYHGPRYRFGNKM
jgi:hypothetical protein